MIEFAMAAHLATRTAVTTVVGTAGIFGDKAPQKSGAETKVPPFITYEQVGGDKFYHTQGASGLAEAAIRITCRGKTYVKSHELYEILRDELDGFSGTWDGTVIRGAFLSEPENISTPSSNLGTDASQYALQGTLTVHYFRDVPTFGES